MKRDDLDLDYFRQLLEEQRSQLLKEIEAVSADTRALEESASEAEDRGDISEIDANNDIDQRLLAHLEAQLKEVNDALKRIADGSYGICEKSGKPIPIERLEAYPAARTRVDV